MATTTLRSLIGTTFPDLSPAESLEQERWLAQTIKSTPFPSAPASAVGSSGGAGTSASRERDWNAQVELLSRAVLRSSGSADQAHQFGQLLAQLKRQTDPRERSTPLILLQALLDAAPLSATHSRRQDVLSTPLAHRGLFPGPSTVLPKIDDPRPASSVFNLPPAQQTPMNDFATPHPARKTAKAPLAAQLAAHRAKATTGPRLPPVPEALLLRDVIYILQGIDGHWIKFNDQPDPSRAPTPSDPNLLANNSFATEVGILFTTSTTHSIPAPTRALLHELAELGWLFRRISRAIEKGKEREDCGMVEQSLHVALGKELTEYFRLIAVLEGQLNFGEGEGATDGEEGLTLRRLLVWTGDVRLRMRMMDVLVGETLELHRGGALLTSLHLYTSNGDPFISAFSSRLLKTLSVPFFATLSSWIYEGELRDPYGEFFVESRGLIDGREERADEDDGIVLGHELWEGKFGFRPEMLPGFLEEAFGRKIFSTGKSLNFMRHSCEDSEWVVTRNRIDGVGRTLQYADMEGLERSITLAYSIASQRLFDLFFDKYRLLDHLRALKDYLMLGKGDFVEILMETLGPSLAKPANMLYRHNLTTTLDLAIKNSTSSSDHPDTLRRLDARMHEFSQGEIGWDVFTLEYKVDAPLDTVLDPKSMEMYEKMFRHLWQIKRVEFSLNEVYRRLSTGARTFLRVPEMGYLFHKTRLAVADVRFFISQLQAYCHSEVIDCSWRVLEDFALKKEGDLDSLIEAHKIYLDRLVNKALLIVKKGDRKNTSLLETVRQIFSVVLKFREAIDSLCDYMLAEAARQESHRDIGRGIASYSAPSRRDPAILAAIEKRLTDYHDKFKLLAREVVVALGSSPDLDMRFLSVRENYNSHYFKPEQKKEVVAA